MGAAGSLYAAFRRALDRGNLTLALAEARDLPRLNLAGSLELLIHIADQDPPTYTRAAGRWVTRYLIENDNVDLDETQLPAAALSGIAGRDPLPAFLTLRSLARRRGLKPVENVVRRWLEQRAARNESERQSYDEGTDTERAAPLRSSSRWAFRGRNVASLGNTCHDVRVLHVIDSCRAAA